MVVGGVARMRKERWSRGGVFEERFSEKNVLKQDILRKDVKNDGP
jgi:hypothetical protein